MGETHMHARSPRLTGPGEVGRGVARRGDGRGRTTCALMVHRNLAQCLAGPRLLFAIYFCYESVSNRF
jgi:hypothetical protein